MPLSTTVIKMAETVHIGKKIQEKFRASGMSGAEFARQLNYERTNIYRIFERESIDTILLMQISEILNFDFFIYYRPEVKP